MPDCRTKTQKNIDDMVGMPLYYCSDCKLEVKVTPVAGCEPVIVRPCGQECGHQIMAPRKAIAAGEGGLSTKDKAKMFYWRLAAALTGRCV